jgi:hypothetical protein
MNKNEGKHCPLVNQTCMLNECTFFNELLDGCEISIINYNLYQLKQYIRAWINKMSGVSVSEPTGEYDKPGGSRFPRPSR